MLDSIINYLMNQVHRAEQGVVTIGIIGIIILVIIILILFGNGE